MAPSDFGSNSQNNYQTITVHNELYLSYLEVAEKLAKEVEEMVHYMGQNKTPEFLYITTVQVSEAKNIFYLAYT